MINLQKEDWFIPGVKVAKVAAGESARQVAIIIDGVIAFFIGVQEDIATKLINSTSFFECESVNDLFCVSIVNNGEVDQVLCNEMTQEAEADRRYDICKSCPELIDLTKQCKQCGCIMSLKTKLQHATCPLGKW